MEHDLRDAPVELVEQLENFHPHVGVADDDDGVGVFVGNDLGRADNARVGLGIGLLGIQFRAAGRTAATPAAAAAILAEAAVVVIAQEAGPAAAATGGLAGPGVGAAGRRAAFFLGSRLADGFDQDIEDIARGDEFERTGSGLAELHARVEFVDELGDELQAFLPRDDVNAVRAHVRGQFDFADDDRILGQPAAANLDGVRRGGHGGGAGWQRGAVGRGVDGPRHLHTARGTGRDGAGGGVLLKNRGEFFQHVLGIGTLEGDKRAEDFRRRDINLANDAQQPAEDGGVFRDEDGLRFRQRGEVGVLPLRLHDVGAEKLRQFSRVGVVELLDEGDDLFALGDRKLVGDDRNGGAARVFADTDDFDDVAVLDGDEGDAVEEQADLDDADGLFLGHVAGDGDGDRRRACDLVVIDEPLFRQPLVEIEDAFEFRELEPHLVGVGGGCRDGRGRRNRHWHGRGRGHAGERRSRIRRHRQRGRGIGRRWQGRVLRQGGGGDGEGEEESRGRAEHEGFTSSEPGGGQPWLWGSSGFLRPEKMREARELKTKPNGRKA